jgi:hypothetical protein
MASELSMFTWVAEVVVTLVGRTKGWVALGFGADGNMPDTDVIWGQVLDRFAHSRSFDAAATTVTANTSRWTTIRGKLSSLTGGPESALVRQQMSSRTSSYARLLSSSLPTPTFYTRALPFGVRSLRALSFWQLIPENSGQVDDVTTLQFRRKLVTNDTAEAPHSLSLFLSLSLFFFTRARLRARTGLSDHLGTDDHPLGLWQQRRRARYAPSYYSACVRVSVDVRGRKAAGRGRLHILPAHGARQRVS